MQSFGGNSALIVKIFGQGDGAEWNKALDDLGGGPCIKFEYVSAYSSFEGDGEPQMFFAEEGERKFAHVFVKYKSIHFDSDNRESFSACDIASPYGYAGALSNTSDKQFLAASWRAFDEWTFEEGIVCEFLRGPPGDEMSCLVHPDIELENNRLISLVDGELTDEGYLGSIKPKQRNMIRRAISEGCIVAEYAVRESLSWFEPWYREAMDRSSALKRFYYDSNYYSSLDKLGDDLKVICVEREGVKLSAAMVIFGAGYNLYHLAATNPDYRVNYASPFLIFGCRQACSLRNQNPLVLGGGRTAGPDDSLYRFKQSVGSRVSQYKIGTRIIDFESYRRLEKLYPNHHSRLIFYR